MKQVRRTPRPAVISAPDPIISDRPFLRRAGVIFAVALAVRLVHVWQLQPTPFSDVLLGDAHGYDEWARRLAAGDWIGTDVFYQAPLYPYFLGVIYATLGSSVLAVRLVQAVIGAGSCAFLAFAGRRFFGDRAGTVAGVMLALYAPAIFFDGLLQKAVLDLASFTLSLWMLGRLVDELSSRQSSPSRGFGLTGLNWLLLGLAMGALSLTRENALVFIIVIVAWALLWRRRDAKAPSLAQRGGLVATFAAGLAIVLLPVAVRNYAVGGGFYLTTSQFGPNFFIGNNPKSTGTYMSLRFGRGAPEFERQDATELAEHALERTLTPAEVSSYWTDRALDFIATQPGAWLRLMGRKLLLLVNGTEMLDTESQESYAEYSWPLKLLGPIGHFGLLAPLALLGALLAWPERRRLGVLYAMTLMYGASVLMFYVFARYRVPLVPLFILFAAHAVVALWQAGQAVRMQDASRDLAAAGSSVSSVVERLGFSRGAAIIGGATLAGLAVAANWAVLSAPLMKAITETNLGTAYQAAGKSDQAVAHYRRAAELQPDYAPAYNNLGVTLRANGQNSEAIDAYRKALTITGEYPDAHYNLANALLTENRADEATEHFNIALRSIPDSAGIRNNLGIALSAQGRTGDALAAFRSAVAAEPGSATAHRNLGDALSAAGQMEEAVRELSRATELAPRDPVAYYNLGVLFLGTDRADRAVTPLTTAVQLNPQSAEAHNNLGIAFGSLGRLDEAIAEFRRALAINPSFADSQRNLETALQARGQRR